MENNFENCSENLTIDMWVITGEYQVNIRCKEFQIFMFAYVVDSIKNFVYLLDM